MKYNSKKRAIHNFANTDYQFYLFAKNQFRNVCPEQRVPNLHFKFHFNTNAYIHTYASIVLVATANTAFSILDPKIISLSHSYGYIYIVYKCISISHLYICMCDSALHHIGIEVVGKTLVCNKNCVTENKLVQRKANFY